MVSFPFSGAGQRLDQFRKHPIYWKFTESLNKSDEQVTILSVNPTCPICHKELECFWGRQGKRFNVFHPTSNCPLRFEDFGHGESEEEAFKSSQLIINNYADTSKVP